MSALPAPDLQRRLPNEVWLAIFDFLHAVGSPLSAVRITCRRFSILAAPLVFRALEWSSRPSLRTHEVENGSEELTELLLRKRELCQHVRSATLAWRTQGLVGGGSGGAGGRSEMPPKLAQVVPLMSNLETVELKSVEISADVLRSLYALPSLKSLVLSDCVPPTQPVISTLKGTLLPIESLTINNVMDHVYRFEDLLSILCTPSLKSFVLPGGEPIPSFFLRTLGTRLTPHTLQHLDIPASAIAGNVLVDFFINQSSLLSFSCSSTDFVRLEIPPTALPLLRRYEGPDNPEALDALIAGRPVRAVCFRPLLYSGSYKERLVRAFRAVARSTAPLEYLDLKVFSLDAALLNTIITMFQHLKLLRIYSMSSIPKELLQETMPEKLLLLRSLRQVDFQTNNVGADESYSRPSSETIRFHTDLVLQWEAACPSLRMIKMDKMEWVFLERGDWLGYDMTPEWKRSVSTKVDVPTAATLPREAAKCANKATQVGTSQVETSPEPPPPSAELSEPTGVP